MPMSLWRSQPISLISLDQVKSVLRPSIFMRGIQSLFSGLNRAARHPVLLWQTFLQIRLRYTFCMLAFCRGYHAFLEFVQITRNAMETAHVIVSWIISCAFCSTWKEGTLSRGQKAKKFFFLRTPNNQFLDKQTFSRLRGVNQYRGMVRVRVVCFRKKPPSDTRSIRTKCHL